jgi:hypothetical protein
MAIILKANKVNLFVSSILFVFWYHSPNVLDKPRRKTSTPSPGFEPTISAGERDLRLRPAPQTAPQTCASDRAATGIGSQRIIQKTLTS